MGKVIVWVLFLAFILASFYSTQAAEYKGKDIDGELYSCTAYSYSTGRFYHGMVEFSDDEVVLTLHLRNLVRVFLTLDDEEIGDPTLIDAYDYRRGVHWTLDVDDLD